MSVLQTLKNEKISLTALSLDLDESIANAQKEVQSSFSTAANTDELSQKLSLLQVQRESLEKAIKSADEAIKQSIADDEAEKASNELSIRQKHVKRSLMALDEAVVLQEKLAQKLQVVADENAKANPTNSEVHHSIRGIVGKLASRFNLVGSLNMASTMTIPNSKNDLERLQNNLNGWR